MKTKINEEKWGIGYDAILAKVASAIKDQEVRVRYSAYENDADGIPVDNLDEVAIPGRVAVLDDQHYSTGEQIYISPIVENPTWLDLTILANKMLNRTMDGHVFLEAFYIIGKHDKTSIIEFGMGS